MAKAPEAASQGRRVIALRPDRLSVAEQQRLARERARVELPTRQRDFSELWGKECLRRGKLTA